MRQIDLAEHQSSERLLTSAERDALVNLRIRNLDVRPVIGAEDKYLLSTGSTVGAIESDEVSVLIQPKIGIANLIAVACYAQDQRFDEDDFGFPKSDSMHDALALALARATRVAFGRGVLRGYRTEEDQMMTVRGRINFVEQLRRRFGVSVPISVRYDEYTDDVVANQLIKAAAHRMGRLRLRSNVARRSLAWISGTLQNVSLVEFPGNRIPEFQFDQLNEHYRVVINLSQLILRNVGFESERGRVRSGGFLIDLNRLFQEFVFQALREKLIRAGCELLSDRNWPQDASLDVDRTIRLKPDIFCWESGRCTFVGDIKYKNSTGGRIPNPDIYQALAYATATGLSHSLLIYASGEADQQTFRIRNVGKTVKIAALELKKPLQEVLVDVGQIAQMVIEMRKTTS